MTDKKVLTIQDISCMGQCSLTVALPIISACGVETIILPSAVLSTHTGGFTGYTFRDLTEDIPGIMNHWEKESIRFDCLYTGYLGSITQIEYVYDLKKRVVKEDGLLIRRWRITEACTMDLMMRLLHRWQSSAAVRILSFRILQRRHL